GGGAMRQVGARGPAVRPREEIDRLRPYRIGSPAPAAGAVQIPPVKLNQNESPLDWPPELKAEVMRRLAGRPWNRYPPVDADALREALAGSHGIGPDQVAVTNGSNEAILALVQTFAGGRSVLLTTPGYSMSAPLAVIGGAAVKPVSLQPDFSLDVPAMVEAARAGDVGMVFIASPNNPTGNAFARPELEAGPGDPPGTRAGGGDAAPDRRGHRVPVGRKLHSFPDRVAGGRALLAASTARRAGARRQPPAYARAVSARDHWDAG